MTLLLTLLGFLIGLASGSTATGLIGAAAGAGLGVAVAQRKTIAALQEDVRRLREDERSLRAALDEWGQRLPGEGAASGPPKQPASAVPSNAEVEAPTAPDSQPTAPPSAAAQRPGPTSRPRPARRESVVKDLSGEAREASPTVTLRPPPPPGPFDRAIERATAAVREFFTGGNTVVRVGLLVLLVGVVLLLKYSADHALFPIELRMASAALLGFALIATGLWQRVARPSFGLPLQGAGVATLYLVVFFSLRAYQLLPAPLAFGLMAGVALASGVLAVAQNSLALIVIGVFGGFMAPILASTGGGDHVVLFSYYLLLNLLIVAVAWFRSWRPLNLLGFAFTFGIGTLWGVTSYRPEHFASTEPFLIAFFLLYVAIVVIFALRRPADLRGWVDGSLTFGTPLAVLGLQYALVEDRPFGMAYTTLAMAVVYVGLAFVLYKRAPRVMRNLVEAFLVLGVGFATLAVPYGFSNQSLAGATWAVEGLGLFWIGVRQKRALSRIAGVALQPMAGCALVWSLLAGQTPSTQPILNAPFAASTLLALSALGIAYLADRHRGTLGKFAKGLVVLIPWALVWWYSAAIREVGLHVSSDYRNTALVGAVAVTGLLFELSGKRLNWRDGRIPALLSVPAMLLLLLQYGLQILAVNPPRVDLDAVAGMEPALISSLLDRGGFVAWPLYGLVVYFTLFRFSRDHPALGNPLHALALWAVAIWAALQSAHSVRAVESLGGSWPVAAVGAGLLLVALGGFKLRPRLRSEELQAVYRDVASGGLALLIALWQVRTNVVAAGAVEPLPYWPLLNPLDLTLGLAFLSCWFWVRSASVSAEPLLIGMAFLWFNGILARTVHHFAGVAYEPAALWGYSPMQVAVSVSWTLIGLTTILWATRSRSRSVWFAGSVLLAVVVGKLFLVDIAHLNPVAKIGTFLVVGVLLLVVGYFSPIPPGSSEVPAPEPGSDGDAS
ncbi:DUF2339 domain-containing protein [Engelhardtia mirabilis]|uniref:Membrane protein (DUF2339) n=1 Tax=Engelhardtia mirabilis TaxID=2528011 RepID=A0A518BGU2_9BACT|nr:hypothetical protein Pla133_12660 [Planctomycetes bacterium Pla133]QDV00527.1 hypothetical protein Pla86_12660 [Planctomycetes bacterium Pla86]